MMQTNTDEIQEARDGYYSRGKRLTNFTVRMDKLMINIVTEERTYVLEFRMEDGTSLTRAIPAPDINSGKWLSKFPVAVWCCDQKAFTQIFRRLMALAESECEVIEKVSPKTGFQRVDGTWRFLFSNGSFTVEGFDPHVYSIRPLFVYNGDKLWVDETETAAYLRLICRRARIFYPILAVNLLSMTRTLFKSYGIDLAATLWLDGRSGSGKTVLAQTFGKFTDPEPVRPDDTTCWHKRRMISSTERPSVVVAALGTHAGELLIIDDVKYENNQRQRDKANAIVDIAIRSVYQGVTTERAGKSLKGGETTVETNVILTGEYRRTTESQNARMMLIDVDDFMQEKAGREALTEAQTNWQRQADLLGGFIRWMLFKAQESGTGNRWRELMRHIRMEKWEYEDRPNGQRLKDTRARFLFITKVFSMYLREKFPRIGEVITMFHHEATDAIEWAMVNTFENLSGLEAVALSIMRSALEELEIKGQIREADYVKEGLGWQHSRWAQEQFSLIEFDDDENIKRAEQALLIPKIHKTFQNTDLEGTALNEGPLFVMAREDFEVLLKRHISDFIKDGRLWEGDEKRINVKLFAKIGVLLVWPEIGRDGRYSKKFPILQYERRWEWEDCGQEKTYYLLHMEGKECVCFNPIHELIQPILLSSHRSLEHVRLDTKLDFNMDEVLKLRRSFVSGAVKLPEKYCRSWGSGGI